MGNKSKSSSDYTRGIGLGGARTGTDCTKLSFDADLVNIQPALGNVKVGEFMSIRLNGKVARCYNADGDHCGDVHSPLNGQLVNCLNDGYYFKAKLLNRKGAIKVQSGR
jgi:hypothetical protein